MLLFKAFLFITLGKTNQCKSNKLKIIAPTWNNEFELRRWFVFSVRYSRLYGVPHKNVKH